MCKKCFCSIVPPNVLKGLSKNGSESAKVALADLQSIKQKRVAAMVIHSKMEKEKGAGKRLIYDSQNTWELRKKLARSEGESEVGDSDVNKVYNIAGFMRDYLMEKFSYDSLDDNGMDLIFSLHYRINYANAFWDGDEMAFGDGDGKSFLGFSNSIDVIAHEIMHGVTQFVANLQYYSQSGALNEHFSDVFGTIIKQRVLNQTPDEADWLIGNDIVGPDFPGIAIRSMKDPGTSNEYDTQPQHMDNYYYGDEDNKGVHINSGIPNKAFYLATMRLGLNATEQIWFQTLKKLWDTADFNNMLDKILETTTDLVNNNRIPENSYSIIEESFSKVGLNRDLLSLHYHIEVSGGLFPMKEVLQGVIKDEEIIKRLEEDETASSTNSSMTDGKVYKFNLSGGKIKKEFSLDESKLNNTLKKIISLAESKKK